MPQLSCFAPSSEAAVPIVPIVTSQFDAWLEAQDDRTKNWITAHSFSAKPTTALSLPDQHGRLEKVLVGVPHLNDLTIFAFLASSLPEAVYKIALPFSLSLDSNQEYQAFLNWGMGSYQFTTYKKLPPFTATLAFSANLDCALLEATLRAIYLIRDMINTPADDMTPEHLGDIALKFKKEFRASVKQIVGTDLIKKNYPAIYAVGRASEYEPRLIDIRWGNSKHPKVTLIGKGVCFDTGGLDLKNAANMATMKKDMAGAAHVFGLAQIIMSLNLPIRLRVLVPAVENVVSGNAYHPGDILSTRKGLTVEVTNTDAEGRLVLADALCEAASESPDLMIDFASLTGAARVALGTDIAALFTPNDQLAEHLLTAAHTQKDPVWRLPLYAPYRKLLDSKVADLMNSSLSPYGGALTAALFLKEFVPDNVPWAHFDIMAWNVSSKLGFQEGGEANAIRAVLHYLMTKFEIDHPL